MTAYIKNAQRVPVEYLELPETYRYLPLTTVARGSCYHSSRSLEIARVRTVVV
jgi:hypothetical protein